MGSRLEANSDAVRKRIASHTFDDEEGDEYGKSGFGEFGDYFRRKKIKLQNLDADIRANSADKPQLFRGVVAHVNGYTQPSLNDLHTLIVQHGGGFMQYLDGKTTVTHIIASNLTPKKAVEFKRYRIVKPAWVVDSIKAGKLLPWNDYRVVDEGENQKVLAFDNGKVLSEVNVKAKGYRDQTDNSWYTSQLRGTPTGEPSSTPNSTLRSRFSRQRLPTPDDDIQELPPSHQPDEFEEESLPEQVPQIGPSKLKKLVTPPKTSPARGQPDDDFLDTNFDQDDSLYAGPDPPVRQRIPEESGNEHEPTCNDDREANPRAKTLTAEEHNAILLRDPKIRKSTVVDPNFLEQYYRESRLHHLSTWKADLKSQLQALAAEKSSSQRAKQKRPPGARRYILHVDFDSFFAAVSLKKNPQFVDKPAVVAHGNGSGSEIASCNYPARNFGVKNGMWMKKALELCPDLKILPYDFPAYEEASRAFYDAIIATGGIVQSVSIDEALIDVSLLCISAGRSDDRQANEGTIYREQRKVDEIAQSLRDLVKQKTGCNVSVGIGGNTLLAKVALRKAKPAGQYHIKPEEILDFIGQLTVQDLPGVAWSIGGKLEDIGVKLVKDIRDLSKEKLVQALGPKTGEKLWDYSRGIDKTEVGEQVVRKSVSAEVNWGVRFENQEQADEFMGSLCGELQKRLLKEKVKGKQFTMKIMRRSPDAPLDPPKHLGHGKCDTFNKSIILGVATNSKEVFTKEALSILKGFGFTPGELRGIGIQVTRLEPMKSSTDGSLDGSQRRLQFKVGTTTPAPVVNPGSVRKAATESARRVIKSVEADEIQDDPETPRKPKHTDDHVAFGPSELNHSTPSRRPLNILGTQFILPSQVDPKVLAELPEDIRSKLLRQARQSSPTPDSRNAQRPKNGTQSPTTRSRVPFPMTALPAHSQLDPEILAALPPDVRAEVLAQYAAGATPASPSRHRFADQSILPQSPRKNRIIGIPAKKPIMPQVKRGRGRPPRSAQLAAAAVASSKTKDGKTLMQANFISLKNPAREEGHRDVSTDAERDSDAAIPNPDAPSKTKTKKGKGGSNDGIDDLDQDFLSALPPDLRKEVIEEHKRTKLRASRLAVTKAKRVPVPAPPRPVPKLRIPRPQKPTFTVKKLSAEKELRPALRAWVEEFRDEGPYREDVEALVKYLRRVVVEERDLGKAVGLVEWFGWVVGEVEGLEEGGVWDDALLKVKEGVRAAGRERGLGDVRFG
ncbi:DNA repair protein [Amniculicola lignicola CBS 123094]|uniref:DNA repair protein REV1 n=1 Tax=Amniculicola lignicola CBS 123094 TaxID=1392246 RepID=A0A6A5W169_9PLEO|nr:DNA repair protein [Amniculicola lignicola CBS 123094]